ncbi:SRPBCC family protein [Nocardia sp. NPDC127526]|uniref:SRPBCC family protein n=1 Tax=Nocardia sp. NPDC127526 TaxID=3345393 RepID=UPI00362CD26A
MNRMTAGAVGAVSAAAGLAAGYRVLAREKCLHWGASAEEAARAMPGDGLLPEPDVATTRAVTISAAPEAIWPWLVQIGPGRGGAYTYDWIENLMGLDMHSADEILPQFQGLAAGDVTALGEKGPRMRVAVLDPGHALVFVSEDHHWVWAFGLYPAAEGTRLVSRNRITVPGNGPVRRLAWSLVMEPGSLVMERKMLLGIKERAERTPLPPSSLLVTNGPEQRSESPYAPAVVTRTLEI